MKTIALYNLKGGVGKTAAAVNLSYLAASEGARTLVWDLDPQGAASYYLNIKAKIKGGGKRLMAGAMAERIKWTNYANLDLLPADLSYRKLDALLEDKKKPTHSVHKLLKPFTAVYDYAFIDCPPSLSLVSENVFYAADVLLTPIIPTILSVRTLDQLDAFLAAEHISDVKRLAFLSMLDRRKKLHRELRETLPRERNNILATAIPYASEVERMGVERMPLHCFAPHGAAAQAFSALWRELKERLD